MKFSKAKAILKPPSTRLVEDEVSALKTARLVRIFVMICQDGIAGLLKDEQYEGMMHIKLSM